MQIKNVVCYSLALASQDVLAQLRILGPYQLAGINIIRGIVDDAVAYEHAATADAVVIQRDFPRKFDDYQKIVKFAKREGKPIIFDLDDLLFSLPEEHPARQSQYYVPSLLPMLQALRDADLVTVSTPKLKDILDPYHNNVAVLPNYFDDTTWQLRAPLKKETNDGVVTIGYMGGNTHDADIDYITPVLLSLINRYGQNIHFHFWGAEPPKEIRSSDQVSWTAQYLYSYKDFAAFFQSQTADIFIAPLLNNLFNRCKSPIKFFDYSALGGPGVYSRLEPYSAIVGEGINGLLAESSDEWLDCMIKLIEDHELRYRLASNAQATIRTHWLLSQNAFRWCDTFRSLIKHNSHQNLASEESIIQSINAQWSEAFEAEQQHVQALNAELQTSNAQIQTLIQTLNAQLQTSNAQIQTLNAELRRLGEQLHEITISRSWRLVMYLRRVAAYLRRFQKL
jgi:glycosyltransferase involved in cell wall biosynthesis